MNQIYSVLKYAPVILITSLLLLVLPKGFSQEALGIVGKSAPPLHVLKWLKGGTVETFATGGIYVIEFSGVGCSPCRASIPHLSSLSKRYSQQVTIISVYVRENGVVPNENVADTAYIAHVRRFIENMGERIRYRIAIDDPRQTMVNTWMNASGVNYTPSAWVIDQSGKVSWIGPSMFLESVIKKVMQKSFDIQLQEHEEHAYTEQLNTVLEIRDASSIHKIDLLIAAYPHHSFLYQVKFNLLLDIDEETGYSFARTILKAELPEIDMEPLLFDMAKTIALKESDLKNPDWDLVIQMTERAAELSQYTDVSAYIFDLMAEAYAKKGDYKKAAECQRMAISSVEQSAAQDESAKKIIERLKKKLQLYLANKNG